MLASKISFSYLWHSSLPNGGSLKQWTCRLLCRRLIDFYLWKKYGFILSKCKGLNPYKLLSHLKRTLCCLQSKLTRSIMRIIEQFHCLQMQAFCQDTFLFEMSHVGYVTICCIIRLDTTYSDKNVTRIDGTCG